MEVIYAIVKQKKKLSYLSSPTHPLDKKKKKKTEDQYDKLLKVLTYGRVNPLKRMASFPKADLERYTGVKV